MARSRPSGEVSSFTFDFSPLYRLAAAPFGITPSSTRVELCGDALDVRFGPWAVLTPLANVTDAEVSGPFSVVKTIGPARLSVADRGLTFATNAERGVCIRFADPVAGLEPLGVLRHPGLTVTVEDVHGLVAALGHKQRTPSVVDVESELLTAPRR